MLELAPPLILVNVLLLGFRHGFDWDHMTAIMDIVGTVEEGGDKAQFKIPLRSLRLACLYALGHAVTCLALGSIALSCHSFTPEWLNQIMERAVGITLIFLGGWILFSLSQSIGVDESSPKSRGQALLSMLQQFFATRAISLQADKSTRRSNPAAYGSKTAFCIGIIHGIGAETATQVLMITAVSGAASHSAGISILAVFVLGLLLSNMLVTALLASGFAASRKIQKVYTSVAILTGLSSLLLGGAFLFGAADKLPSPEKILESSFSTQKSAG
ncbi:MAG: hypothetical protein K2X27_25350 [Candidatus Obscuribacterales bacterium]|nr:hypothetical protein [Candidatus Obscuribacterales bacterium]